MFKGNGPGEAGRDGELRSAPPEGGVAPLCDLSRKPPCKASSQALFEQLLLVVSYESFALCLIDQLLCIFKGCMYQ